MFPHLHVHTHFSFGIGVSSPEVLAAAAATRGYRALACTDTNGVYGAVEFQRACESAGLRPILGAHLVSGGEETVALAADERGWGALCRAITEIHWAVPPLTLRERSDRRGRSSNGAPPLRSAQGDNSGARISEHLAHDRGGLVLLSRDTAFLERVLRLSGSQDLYAELVPGKERHAVLAEARRLG
ncbi:MAG: PHP domain-containing protein, partial [Gemmatimonadota bacterium]|nr:PHP domain-containing protein [Gemmatimonadota bacterium]